LFPYALEVKSKAFLMFFPTSCYTRQIKQELKEDLSRKFLGMRMGVFGGD
jgi:hypothetical protein